MKAYGGILYRYILFFLTIKLITCLLFRQIFSSLVFCKVELHKAFDKFAKETASEQYKIEPLFQENNSLTMDSGRISEILSEQFESIFTSHWAHADKTSG